MNKIPEVRENIINVPNLLTILRFLFSPVFLYFLLKGRIELALITFMFVAVTDLADGWIARSTKTKTKFGELMDPIADKFMIFLGLYAVIEKFGFPLGMVPLVISRDLVSLLSSFVVYAKHRENWKPNIFGKLTTFFQIATILAYIINLKLKSFILYLTVALSLITAILYLNKLIQIMRTPKTKVI